jgi:hypothetical protein
MSSIPHPDPNRKQAFAPCPVCDWLHPVITCTVIRDATGEDTHLAHMRCDEIGKQVSVKLVVYRMGAAQ